MARPKVYNKPRISTQVRLDVDLHERLVAEAARRDVSATKLILLAYSKALDEVYRLRRALAYEARVVEAHLGYKTFPKTRRKIAEEQVERMRLCARGEAGVVYAGVNYTSLNAALRAAGASETLTRAQWEAE